MSAEQKFVDGLFVKKPENAPEYVVAKCSFNERFITYLQHNFNSRGYVNVDILISKEGKLYAKKDDWQPQEKFIKEDGKLKAVEVEREMDELDAEREEIRIENIPF